MREIQYLIIANIVMLLFTFKRYWYCVGIVAILKSDPMVYCHIY